MSDRELRFGVIGTGMMGCEHLRNLMALPDARVVAFSDPTEESREWARLTLDDASVAGYASHAALLDHDGLDAVVIASPNHTHIDLLTDVLATEVPVLVEKPLCTTVTDCRTVEGLAAARSAITWVGLEYRYMPPVAAFIDAVHSGSAGAVKMVFIREHRFPFLPKVDNWNRFTRNTGGTLVEKCCHFFDLICVIPR